MPWRPGPTYHRTVGYYVTLIYKCVMSSACVNLQLIFCFIVVSCFQTSPCITMLVYLFGCRRHSDFILIWEALFTSILVPVYSELKLAVLTTKDHGMTETNFEILISVRYMQC